MIQVGEVTIGSGRPKICASITETTRKAIIAAADILMQRSIDIVEWRIDFYEDVDQWDQVKETLQRLKMSLAGKPMMVTFRTAAEGGEREISIEDYKTLLTQVADSRCAQMIDVEIFKEVSYEERKEAEQSPQIQEKLRNLMDWIENLREKVVVVGSYHDFDKTPCDEELYARMDMIAETGVDIPKMAVMPQNKRDVLRLMTFTLEESEKLDKPLITMSMGKIGSVSRAMGEAFGSAVTFGSAGQASAPGQIAVSRLDQVLDIIHQNYQ